MQKKAAQGASGSAKALSEFYDAEFALLVAKLKTQRRSDGSCGRDRDGAEDVEVEEVM